MERHYPTHWEADVVLADGGAAHLRPITADDADRLRAFHSRLSPQSIYFRFFSPRPTLTDTEVRRFTEVDYDARVALIATIGAQMVAVVRYERFGQQESESVADSAEDAGPDTAEVAFLVEDAHQGRGLASIMLEHLAAAAQERRVHRFVAEVLPQNQRMINVFRAAGYSAHQRFDEGVVRLTLELTPTRTFNEVVRAREHRAEARSIARLVAPTSVAVIGAGRDPAGVGNTVLRHLLEAPFTGPVYPVHPSAGSVAGVAAYPSVGDIPGRVDLAVLAVPADAVPKVVSECSSKGVHALVVISSGFAETGDQGRLAQDELVRSARAGGMRVVGPNCLGVLNTAPATTLNATLSPVMPPGGRVGFFSQSGALGISLLHHAAQRGLGLSTFVSAGNRADVSGNDLLQYWDDDPATEVVLLYLESFGNPRKFSRLCRRVARRKPVVAVSSGGAAQGVPLGHAVRALELPESAISALLAQAGVIRADDITQLFDVAELLAHQPLPAGPHVGIVGNSDSLGLLAEAACLRAGLRPRRPIDLGPDATPDELESAVAQVSADDGVDSVIAVFIPPVRPADRPARHDLTEAARSGPALLRAVSGSDKPVVTTYLGYQGLPPELRASGAEGGPPRGSLPSYQTPEQAVRALARATEYARWRRAAPGVEPELDGIDTAAARAVIEGWLGAGIEQPDGQEAELLTYYGIAQTAPPGDGVPTRIVAWQDPAFGPVVSFGLAYPTAELLDDRTYRAAPLTDVDVASLISDLRAAPLLFGHGGTDPVDVRGLEDLLSRVARIVDELPAVASVELAPVLATPDGAAVRGATIRLGREPLPRPDFGPRRLR